MKVPISQIFHFIIFLFFVISGYGQDLEANKKIHQRLYDEIYNQQKLDVVDEIYSPDFLAHGSDAEGNDFASLKPFFTAYFTAFPDLHVTIDDQVAEGDMVATRYTATGTQTGAFMGIPPTKQTGIIKGMIWSRIQNGKIVESWNNSDGLGLMQQLGVMPVTEENPVYSWRETKEEGTGDPGTPEENKALIRRLYEEVWNQGQLSVIDAIYPSDWSSPLTPGGKEGFKQYVAGMRTIFANLHYTIEDQIAEGDMVVTRIHATGMQVAEFNGIPATGRTITMTGMNFNRVENNQIAQSWNLADMLGVIQTLTSQGPSTAKQWSMHK